MADDTRDLLALLQPWIQHYQVTLPDPIYLPSGLAEAIKRLPPDFALTAQDKKLELDQMQVCIANLICLEAIYQANTELFLKAKKTDQDVLFLDRELKAISVSYQSAVIWQEQMLQLQQKLEIAIQAYIDQLQTLLQQHKQLFDNITTLNQEIVEMHNEVQQLQETIQDHAKTIDELVQVHDTHVEQVDSMILDREQLQKTIDAQTQEDQDNVDPLREKARLLDQKLVDFKDTIQKIAQRIDENKAQQKTHQEKAFSVIKMMQPKQQALQKASTEWVRVGKKIQHASAAVAAFAEAIPDQKRTAVFSNFKNIVTDANLNMKMEKAVECMRHSAVLLSTVELAASSLVKNSNGTLAVSQKSAPHAIVFSSVNAATAAALTASKPASPENPHTANPGPKI